MASKEDVYELIKKTNVKALSCSSIFHFTEITPTSFKVMAFKSKKKLMLEV